VGRSRRHDADDVIGGALEYDLTAHEAGIGAIFGAPEAVGQHDGWNHDRTAASGKRPSLDSITLWLPCAVLAYDYILSMTKVKTHHWAGFAVSMKNMFGVVPGTRYSPRTPSIGKGFIGPAGRVQRASILLRDPSFRAHPQRDSHFPCDPAEPV
jgi:hypothetical protein